MRLLIFIILLFCFYGNTTAQNVLISGIVQDSTKNVLENANILAIPNKKDGEMRFAITNSKGRYQLKLKKNQKYKLTISYIGYVPNIDSIVATKNNTKNFILKEDTNTLDEVVVKYEYPIIVKEDTITYKLDKFTNGNERKLRDALKKLPGIEVDRAGNVTALGKPISKLLVDNKPFFGGNTKLGVNNIPADAVDKVDVLENYNEVALLKGLEDSELTALNIQLKKDKKKFTFGDIKISAGNKDKYAIHPNIFYYSPKTNINFIGDINNVGTKGLTFQDYLDFEGGFNLVLTNPDRYYEVSNSSFAKYLSNQDFTSNKNKFSALNIRQSFNKAFDIDGYVISTKAETKTKLETINEYVNINNPFTENRISTNAIDNFFTIGKITIDYNPNKYEDFTYNSYVKVTNSNSNRIINTSSLSQNNVIETLSNLENVHSKQKLNYTLKLSEKHTATIDAIYNFDNNTPDTNWLTNHKILQGLIPIQDQVNFNIQQTRKTQSHNIKATIKDYWVVNNLNHIYTSVGFNTNFNSFKSTDKQILENGTSNNFSSAGFNNNFKYNFINTFVGVEYKFQIGIVNFKPSLVYNYYLWNTNHFSESFSNNKSLLLPKLKTEIEFGNNHKIDFNYQLNARFANIGQLADNFILTGFNSIFKGNNNLENSLYHNASITYYKFTLSDELNYNFSTSYNKQVKSFKNVTQLDGINQFRTQIIFDLPEQSLSFGVNLNKKVNKIQYNIGGNFRYSDFYQIVNNNTNKNISRSFNTRTGLRTAFKKYPNLEIEYNKNFNIYSTFNNKNTFNNETFFTSLNHTFLKNFTFDADYKYEKYNNKNLSINNTFNTANASLLYQIENSPWSFEITSTNIFDVKFKQSNSFSSFLISDSKTFLLPRITLLSISYKL